LWLAWSALHVVPPISLLALASARRARPVVTPEELFAALDGRTLTSGGNRLTIEVFSVRDEAGSRWIQLALKGSESQHVLTLRLKPGETAQRVMFTLSSWLTDPTGTSEVINVA